MTAVSPVIKGGLRCLPSISTVDPTASPGLPSLFCFYTASGDTPHERTCANVSVYSLDSRRRKRTQSLLPPMVVCHFVLQIPNFFWSLGIGHTGAWWHTGRRRLEWGGSTVSKSPPWISSMIYLRGMAFASDSSIRTTRVSWYRKCGARSAVASS